MIVRAGVSLLGMAAALATTDTLRRQILEDDRGASTATRDAAFTAAVAAAIASGIVLTLLYGFLVLRVRSGKNWARIVACAVAGLGVASVLASLGQPAPGAVRLTGLAGGVVDLCLVALLARRGPSRFFRDGA
jgi:hypothetical protein